MESRSPKPLSLLGLASLYMLETMADFPPNPEDGELWLPSDVFHEIVSATIRPENNPHQALIKNVALDHVDYQVAIERKSSAARSLSEVVSNFQIKQKARGSFHGTKPNGNGAIGNGVPAFDHCASWDGGYSLFRGQIHLYNSISSIQHQGFEKTGRQKSPWTLLVSTRDEVNGFVGKSGGTGVFFPRPTDASKDSEQSTMDTGVFLNHHVCLTSGKKKKSGKKGQGNRKKCVDKMETLEDQEESQLSNEIGLPREWTY